MFSQHLNVASWCLHGGPFVDFPTIRFWDSEITALYIFSDVPKCKIMHFWDLWIFTRRYHFWRTLSTFLVFLAFPNVVLLRVSCFLGVSKYCVIKVLDCAFFWCLRNLAFSGFLKACISENTPSVKDQAHAMSSETPPVGEGKTATENPRELHPQAWNFLGFSIYTFWQPFSLACRQQSARRGGEEA